MNRLRRIIAAMFIAVFAASSVAHAVSANSMSLDMAVSTDEVMPETDCPSCIADMDANELANSCDLDCTATGFTEVDITTWALFAGILRNHKWRHGMNMSFGLNSFPDPFPPRVFI